MRRLGRVLRTPLLEGATVGMLVGAMFISGLLYLLAYGVVYLVVEVLR